ncbi:hypothetical protein Tsubulata_021238 [Turnera subulata]|uniref:YTH domain-containing family protein n=1 Tax=Turnera subulata TaxID=218843 RepID=A0A9Q0F3I8_9ROSI|nr:hypothetical protein Tsubulata_021238 [Turnera subulata]
MATVAPSADRILSQFPLLETSDLLQNLSLDSQAKTQDAPELPKKVQSCERSMTPLLPSPMDPSLCYHPYGYPSYYYGGYNGTGNEWDDYSRCLNADGVDVTSGVYGNNGSVMYQHAYGFGPYGPYSPAASPAPSVGSDDQFYGPLQYQHPPFVKPLTHTSTPFTPNKAASPKVDHSISKDADQKPLPEETAKGNSDGNENSRTIKGSNGSVPYKPKHQNSYGRNTFPGGLRAPGLWSDTSLLSNGQCRSSEMACSFPKAGGFPSSWNQNPYFMALQHPSVASGITSTDGFINRMYQKKMHGHYGNGVKSGMGFGYCGYNMGTNGYGWWAIDHKYKPRGRGNDYYGFHSPNIDGLNELSKGPRNKDFRNQKSFTLSSDNSSEEDKMTVIPDGELYNRADFLEDHAEAKFYIIKSYSEDDVHKSIKYNVWSSTSSGNKKLDAAYKEAQQKPCGCPVFLFFSVNTSGQFVGLAEMMGSVDFDKSVEHWQQDKWTGCFPVKWHIVKDVPNSLLKHLTLENNENKPVTNSRDTQEVKLEQGLKMIKIFKDHSSKTSILDDFEFYDERAKIIQQRKAKQQLNKKKARNICPIESSVIFCVVWEGRPGGENKELTTDSQKSLESLPDLSKEAALTAKPIGEEKPYENGFAAEAGDESKAGKIVYGTAAGEMCVGTGVGAVEMDRH